MSAPEICSPGIFPVFILVLFSIVIMLCISSLDFSSCLTAAVYPGPIPLAFLKEEEVEGNVKNLKTQSMLLEFWFGVWFIGTRTAEAPIGLCPFSRVSLLATLLGQLPNII